MERSSGKLKSALVLILLPNLCTSYMEEQRKDDDITKLKWLTRSHMQSSRFIRQQGLDRKMIPIIIK